MRRTKRIKTVSDNRSRKNPFRERPGGQDQIEIIAPPLVKEGLKLIESKDPEKRRRGIALIKQHPLANLLLRDLAQIHPNHHVRMQLVRMFAEDEYSGRHSLEVLAESPVKDVQERAQKYLKSNLKKFWARGRYNDYVQTGERLVALGYLERVD